MTRTKDLFEKKYENHDDRWTNENPPQELAEFIDSESIGTDVPIQLVHRRNPRCDQKP